MCSTTASIVDRIMIPIRVRIRVRVKVRVRVRVRVRVAIRARCLEVVDRVMTPRVSTRLLSEVYSRVKEPAFTYTWARVSGMMRALVASIYLHVGRYHFALREDHNGGNAFR